MTASIGVATADAAHVDERMTPAVLMHVADAALYEAKRRGGNTVAADDADVSAAPEREHKHVLSGL